MKKKFESPTIDTCEFVVAARLSVSGTGIAHSAGKNSPCTQTASNGSQGCAPPTSDNSSGGNTSC